MGIIKLFDPTDAHSIQTKVYVALLIVGDSNCYYLTAVCLCVSLHLTQFKR